MACNTCTTVCPIHPCYTALWIAKATANNVYRVELTNLGSGRIQSEVVTATSEGIIKLTGGTWSDFLNTESQVQIKIYLVNYSVSPSAKTNIDVDFYVITGFAGEYYNLTPTWSATKYDCILVDFEMLYDSNGVPIELDNQYLINEDA